MTGTLLSFGHGYSARALSRLLVPQGWRVIGTTRSADKAAALAAEGVEGVVWPGSDLTGALEGATHLLVSAGPSEDGDPVLAALRDQIADRAAGFDWVGYLSTTGVYGDHGGGWVDETSPLATAATDPAAAEIVAAEDTLAAVAPVARLRCAGIYGGADGFLQRRVASGSLCPPTPVHYSNRIHRDDVGGFLAHLLTGAARGSALAPAYNVVDDLPAPQATVEAWLAQRLGVPESEHRYDARPLSRGHKRLRNDRLHESGYRLRYPDYTAGYAAALAAAGT